MSAEAEVRQPDQRWADAGQRGDVGALAGSVTDDCLLAGPLGFTLIRQQWLEIGAPRAFAQDSPEPQANQEAR